MAQSHFGYEQVINYHGTADLVAALHTACPDGIDIFYDNVAGAQADSAFPLLNPRLFSAGDGPTEGLKYLQQAYRTPTPEAMMALVNIIAYDKSFATPELCKARSDAALSCPEHLANFLDMLSKGGLSNRWAPMDQLMKMQIPALLIHGRDDRLVPYEHSLLLCAHIPNSRLVLLNRCGHWAMIEHAKEFNRLVTDFVSNN